MEYINIEKIKVGDNPRKDFGDMEELKRSVKESGIIEPLVLTLDNELLAGGRRLKAAKELGMKEVPFVVKDSTDRSDLSAIKLIENIQRKNLNPIEEAKAFREYIDAFKKTDNQPDALNSIMIEELSNKLGKSKQYIEQRLHLINAKPKVQEALIKRKIGLGHAAVIARLDEKKQDVVMKKIIDNNYNLEDIDYAFDNDVSKDLEDAMFDKKVCANCNHNGSEQTLLIDAGDAVKGKCLKPKCFIDHQIAWKKNEIEVIKKKGINIIDIKDIKEIKGAKEIHTYDDKYDKAVKNLEKKPDIYAVVFDSEYNDKIEKQIWQIKEEKKPNQTKEESNNEVSAKLNMNRKEKLKYKVDEWRRDFLLEQSEKQLKSDHIAKVLAIYHFTEAESPGDISDKELKAMLNPKSQGLNDKLRECVKQVYCELDDDQLYVAAKATGVDYSKDFVMTEEFLKLHTKDQLIDLAKEQKIDTKGLTKNSQMVAVIMTNWKKGQVPKIIGVLK